MARGKKHTAEQIVNPERGLFTLWVRQRTELCFQAMTGNKSRLDAEKAIASRQKLFQKRSNVPASAAPLDNGCHAEEKRTGRQATY
jgi:hypothetical protein